MKFKFEKNRVIKGVCLTLLVLLLMIPMLKEHSPILNRELNASALKGYFEPIERPAFSLKNWWSGAFQNSREEILKRDLGIRSFAFRVNNQLHHAILKEIRTNYIEGKDGYLFGKDYIEDYMGFRYVGDNNMRYQTIQIKYISDKLKELFDVELIVAIAPSKAYVLKEKLPQKYDLNQKVDGNYEIYLAELERLDIKVLDFNKYLTAQVKETGEKEHILMPKLGIHWSEYAATLAADSITNYIGQLKEKDVVRVNQDEIVKTTKSRNQDEDISESMNLLYPLASQKYSYLENFARDTIGKYKPNIVLIGDSFGWTLWSKEIPHKLWGEESLFLYYYYNLWIPNEHDVQKTNKEMLVTYAKKADAIVLLYTPMTMDSWGSGFIERFYTMLKKEEGFDE